MIMLRIAYNPIINKLFFSTSAFPDSAVNGTKNAEDIPRHLTFEQI